MFRFVCERSHHAI
ncbi:hypothetical protein AB6A40_005136 [Gnathostoma spinigerum]|uniref:Uncharacterized protein n=1 Tax=Gnathostoma spinigerum TaxID=75299 RepID=A0ABD6EPE3_9BILA